MILKKIDKSKIHSIKIDDKNLIVNYWGCYFDECILIWNSFSHVWEKLEKKDLRRTIKMKKIKDYVIKILVIILTSVTTSILTVGIVTYSKVKKEQKEFERLCKVYKVLFKYKTKDNKRIYVKLENNKVYQVDSNKFNQYTEGGYCK